MASLFHWVSGIKEAYKGLLNGDILEGVKLMKGGNRESIVFSRIMLRLAFKAIDAMDVINKETKMKL